MRPKRPLSKTLASRATAQGLPDRIARRAVMQDVTTGKICTLEDWERIGEAKDTDDLKWLLDAIQAKSDKATLATVAGEIGHFVRGLADTEAPVNVAPAALRRLLKEAHEGIEDFVIRRTKWEVRLTGRISRKVEWIGRLSLASYEGSWRTAFLLRAFELVERCGDRIHVCALASCGRLFLKHKRQDFCSKSCSQRARTDRLQARPDWQERRHSYYRKKVATEKGSAAAKHVVRRRAKASEIGDADPERNAR
jgi:hypothetical protein